MLDGEPSVSRLAVIIRVREDKVLTGKESWF